MLSHNLMSQRSGGFPGLAHLVKDCPSWDLALCSPVPHRQPPWLQRRQSQAAILSQQDGYGSLGLGGCVIFGPENHSVGKGGREDDISSGDKNYLNQLFS